MEICRRLKREPLTITVIVKRMIKHGLLEEIERTKESGGKRYQITGKGIAAYNNSRKSDNINYILSVLTDEEKEVIFKYLVSIRDQAVKVYYGVKAAEYFYKDI